MSDTFNQERYRLLKRDIQTGARRDKNYYLKNICTEIQVHADNNKKKDQFLKIRQTTNKFKPKN